MTENLYKLTSDLVRWLKTWIIIIHFYIGLRMSIASSHTRLDPHCWLLFRSPKDSAYRSVNSADCKVQDNMVSVETRPLGIPATVIKDFRDWMGPLASSWTEPPHARNARCKNCVPSRYELAILIENTGKTDESIYKNGRHCCHPFTVQKPQQKSILIWNPRRYFVYVYRQKINYYSENYI
jgi:hypothetical protein